MKYEFKNAWEHDLKGPITKKQRAKWRGKIKLVCSKKHSARPPCKRRPTPTSRPVHCACTGNK